jgi:hypothetical protein
MLFILSGSKKIVTFREMISTLSVMEVYRRGDHTIHGSSDKKINYRNNFLARKRSNGYHYPQSGLPENVFPGEKRCNWSN